MNILALEPYYGGSHRAFLDGWIARSCHRWTLCTLPPYHWKWRMRHAAVTLADRLPELGGQQAWDLLFCSDMLNLAEFLGLAGEPLRGVPTIAYFHENQLTYPARHEDPRDLHFALTNLITALAADQVWFNSAYHRDSFLGALGELLARMPDEQPLDAPQRIRAKSAIQPPGVDRFPPRGPRVPGPMRIAWAARWEHDKNPEEFFEALRILQARDVDFHISVMGERFREVPEVFEQAEADFGPRIDRWGFQPTRDDYRAALSESDVFVSTASHEFFGISVVEAIAAGAYPLLPRRLAYPEILEPLGPEAEPFLYDGVAVPLADRLQQLAERLDRGDLWTADPQQAGRVVERFQWDRRSTVMDRACRQLAGEVS